MVDQRASESPHFLAETKFQPPLLRDDLIPRRHLIDDLHSKLVSHPLTLLSAPAGYGKTTLLARLPQTYPGIPITWLSLDEEDNDPARFLTALIAALQHLKPSCGAAAQSLLTDPNQSNARMQRVVSVLINDVLESFTGPFALILDDLHRVYEPAIFVTLNYLLEHPPPKMHLVLATRVDPPLALARLRARGKVAELRMADLRFSEAEARAFLNDHLHLGLSAQELALLQSRTEGWAVGLRLLASSLDPAGSAEDRGIFIQHLAQTDRNIFDFLAEEVFNQQEGELRDFLMETSILNELTPTLCQAVTNRDDAVYVLEDLYRRNLFLVQISPSKELERSKIRVSGTDRLHLEAKSLQHERRYRYHDLFAGFLNRKLREGRSELLPDLHLRAAQAERDPVQAVNHYLAAERWLQAAEIVEQIGVEMFNRGYLETLNRWINRFPTSVRESHPRLLHYLSNIAFLNEEWAEMQSLLERALHGFEAAGDETGQGEVLVNLATCIVGQGDLERSIDLHSQALEYPIPAHTRVQALLGRALAEGALGDWEQTERDFNAAMSLIQQSGELDPLYLLTLPFFHPDFAFLPGGLEHLERITRQAKAQLGDEVSPSRLMVEEMRTVLRLFRGEIGEAICIGEKALTLRKQLGGHPYLSQNAALSLMIAHTARGDYAAVEPLFDVLFLGVDQTDQPTIDLALYLFYAGRVRWLSGRYQKAGEIFEQMCVFMGEDPQRELPEARICLAWMEALLEMAGGRCEQAERILRQPEVLEQKDGGSRVHGCTRLMLARLYWRQDRQAEALAELAPVLDYYEKLGIPFTILVEGQSVVPLLRLAVEQGVHEHYAANLLATLGANQEPHPIQVPHTGETLTPREVEVLRQIVQGASNRDIAERLVITESTVKTHVYHIFSKMDVSNRTEAAALTRELRLL
jgi:LuxR family maltose regulon positive regulatory protein